MFQLQPIHYDIRDHWRSMKIQHKENSGQTVDCTNWQQTQSDLDFDVFEKHEHDQIDRQQTTLRLQIESIEQQIDMTEEDQDRTLYCFCSSDIPGAWQQHYMCQSCYNAWKRQGPDKTCPFCRARMNEHPVRMTWTNKNHI